MMDDRADFWVLDSAVRNAWEVSLLTRDDPEPIESVYNLNLAGIPPAALRAALARLIDRRDISVQPRMPRPGRTAPSPSGNLYRLTAQGGARWEVYARPDWRRYISRRGVYQEEWTTIIAQDRRLVERYLAAWPHVCRDEPPIVPGSAVWDVVSPWEATYWKLLSHGHRLRVRTAGNASPHHLPDPHWVVEFKRETSHWYTDYLGRQGYSG